jgi:hypothetical protein
LVKPAIPKVPFNFPNTFVCCCFKNCFQVGPLFFNCYLFPYKETKINSVVLVHK